MTEIDPASQAEKGLRVLLQIALDEIGHVVDAVDHQHDTKPGMLKYGAPYAAITAARKVREDCLAQAAAWGLEIVPVFQPNTGHLPAEPTNTEIRAFLGQYKTSQDCDDIRKLLAKFANLTASRETVSELRSYLAKRDAVIEGLTEALGFYADPYSYHAIGIFPDRPCGEFANDYGEVEMDWGPDVRHGKRAREALATLASPQESKPGDEQKGERG